MTVQTLSQFGLATTQIMPLRYNTDEVDSLKHLGAPECERPANRGPFGSDKDQLTWLRKRAAFPHQDRLVCDQD